MALDDKDTEPTSRGITLARNPLGIISLFVFFIEAIATVSLKIAIGSEYVGHIVWFIILFPTLIVLLFFGTLWAKRECLYSPGEFRDDKGFIDLLSSVERLEAKQAATEIDVTTELADVLKTVDRLIELDDVYGAVAVGRAFLKQQQYQKSLEVFSYLARRVGPSDRAYYKVLANLGYSLVGVGKYPEAITTLKQVGDMGQGSYLRAWHSLAIAYAYFKSGDMVSFRTWLEATRSRPEFAENAQFFIDLYPEISRDIKSALEAA